MRLKKLINESNKMFPETINTHNLGGTKMNLIFTTCGISSITNHIKGKEFWNDIANKDCGDWNEVYGKSFYQQLNNQIGVQMLSIDRFSAETNSLSKMVDEGLIDMDEDELILLHSDTLDGLIAAKMLQQVLGATGRWRYRFKNIEIRKMENIRGDDADLFADGLVKLRDLMKTFLKGDYEKVIFNITAGFKGLVPVITVFSTNDTNTNYFMAYQYERTEKIVIFKFCNGQITLNVDDKETFIEDFI